MKPFPNYQTVSPRLSEKGRKTLLGSLTEHRNGSFRPILASLRFPNLRSEYRSYPFSDSLSTHSAEEQRGGRELYRRLLSLLVSNLSSTRSKASVPMRAPPEKGCSMAPMVNSTSPITAARVTTINLCAQVFCSPKR